MLKAFPHSLQNFASLSLSAPQLLQNLKSSILWLLDKEMESLASAVFISFMCSIFFLSVFER